MLRAEKADPFFIRPEEDIIDEKTFNDYHHYNRFGIGVGWPGCYRLS
jgi:hypothetical protein